MTTWVRSLPPELARRGTGVRGLRHARLIHERAWFDSRVPHSMRGRLTAGRLALTQVIGVRNPASQSSRHHRLTDRPPGSQSGDRSSNLRGAITFGMWRSWQRARFGTARPHVRIVPSRLQRVENPKTRLRCVSGSTLGLYPRRYGSTPYGGSGVIRRASHRGPRQRGSRKVRTRMRGRPRIKPPRAKTPGDAQVALRGRAWQQRRMTAPAARPRMPRVKRATGSGRATPSVRSHERPAGRGHRWMMGRASAPTESGLSPPG